MPFSELKPETGQGVTCGAEQGKAGQKEPRLALPWSACQAIPPRPGAAATHLGASGRQSSAQAGEGEGEACHEGQTCLLSSLPLSPLLQALLDWGCSPDCGPLRVPAPFSPTTLLWHVHGHSQ